MLFKSEQHKAAYTALIERDHTREGDTERHALFYLLALIGGKADNYYNFEKAAIIPESVSRPELTGTGRRALRLAFVLYNDFPDGEGTGLNDIFEYAGTYAPYFLEAIRIRHNITEPGQLSEAQSSLLNKITAKENKWIAEGLEDLEQLPEKRNPREMLDIALIKYAMNNFPEILG